MLNRLALRLAAVEALNPYATLATGPWPTIAGPLVYDSRVDLIDGGPGLDAIEAKPLLVVYTEQDTTTPYGQAKYPADETVVHLVVEAMIAAKGVVEIQTAPGVTEQHGTLDTPIADPETEALLDLLEAQVRRVLDPRTRVGTAALFGTVAMETHRVESVPQRAGDRVTRIAARTVTFALKIKSTAWPAIPADPLPTGLAALPDPLRTVALALDPNSAGGRIVAGLAGRIAPPAPLPPPGQVVIVSPGSDPMDDPAVTLVAL